MALYLPQYAIVIFDVLTFSSFVFISAMLIYLGRSTHPNKKITLPWVSLSLGVLLFGLPYALEVTVFSERLSEVSTFIPSYFFILIGALMTFTSFTALYLQRVNEVSSLNKRQEEIRAIMERLKERYLKRELSEADLK